MTTARPCRYCVANWAAITTRHGGQPLRPDPIDCEYAHRDDPRVYALAAALAKALTGNRQPTDEQTAWYLEDADEVVDDFDPAPEVWRASRLRTLANDGERGIEVRLRINGVTYVALEGDKGCRGSVMRLSTFRASEAP